jgi:hypothetical protein
MQAARLDRDVAVGEQHDAELPAVVLLPRHRALALSDEEERPGRVVRMETGSPRELVIALRFGGWRGLEPSTLAQGRLYGRAPWKLPGMSRSSPSRGRG